MGRQLASNTRGGVKTAGFESSTLRLPGVTTIVAVHSRLAKWESSRLTRGGSGVRVPHRLLLANSTGRRGSALPQRGPGPLQRAVPRRVAEWLSWMGARFKRGSTGRRRRPARGAISWSRPANREGRVRGYGGDPLPEPNRAARRTWPRRMNPNPRVTGPANSDAPGGVAQLVEHLLCKQAIGSSSLSTSTGPRPEHKHDVTRYPAVRSRHHPGTPGRLANYRRNGEMSSCGRRCAAGRRQRQHHRHGGPIGV